MVLEDKWSWKRFRVLGMIALITLIMTVTTALIQRATTQKIILFSVVGIVFCLLFTLNIEWERMEKGFFHEKANNFKRIGFAYMICCALTIIMSLLPAYVRPVLVISLLMAVVSSTFSGLMLGCYCSVLLGFSGGGSSELFAYFVFMSISGCVMSMYIRNKNNLFWSNWIILTSTFCFGTIFSFLENMTFSWWGMLYSIISGLASCVMVSLIFRLWNDKIENGRDISLDEIIQEEYELAQQMKMYSPIDYEHARKVSRIGSGCAKALGIDEKLVAAAGFYYRIGRLEGEPFVENGIEIAQKHDFPPELIRILGEYNGEKYLPSTVESALVHIVDNIVAKFDVFDSSTLKSGWNQDIIVYQTLNENSAKGLYDKSGLSMNMFLVVRDYLIKEAGLCDRNH